MSVVLVPEKWDYEADVIVVGAGTAGLPAGIEAAEAGVKVAVLELMSYCASSLALVNIGPAFAGTDVQQQEGIDDSPDQYYRDGVERAKGSPEIWRAFADNQLDTYRWCKRIGMEFKGLYAVQGHSKKRGFWVKGSDALRVLEKTAKAKGVEILFLHRATRLITDPQTGRVLGLKVRVKDDIKEFKAKRAVILATGGFGRNREMVEEYGPAFVNCVPTMPPGHLGDGLRMGLAVGAATKNLGSAVISSFSIDAETKTGHISFMLHPGGISVNVNGKRFWDESNRLSFYGLQSKEGMRQPGGNYWVVYDEKVRKNAPIERLGKAKPYQANTIEELAKQVGIDAKGLKETIDKYNSDIETVGYDTVFNRRTLVGVDGTPIKIDTPPFFAIRCAASTSSFKGGLMVNTRCQVIDQYDEVIPSLFAAGELTGGLWGSKGTYLPGTMVSASMTFGRIAAKNAVKEPSW